MRCSMVRLRHCMHAVRELLVWKIPGRLKRKLKVPISHYSCHPIRRDSRHSLCTFPCEFTGMETKMQSDLEARVKKKIAESFVGPV